MKSLFFGLLLIYCQHISPRIEYTFKVLFTVLCKAEYTLSQDREQFLSYEGPKINYSPEELNAGLQLLPSELMFGQTIEEIDLKAGTYQDKVVLFTHIASTALPYDPVAAIFYMISRYEEYLPHEADEHGRFKLTSSKPFKLGFYDKPVTHYWLEDLLSSLKHLYPSFEVTENQYHFQPTFDIDNAYAYLNKPFGRKAGAVIKSLLTNARDLPFRMDVLKGRKKDPYDTYTYIQDINGRFDKKAIFFILTSNKGKYDRNIDPRSEAFTKLVKELKKHGKLGLHPSYLSNEDDRLLKKEKDILQRILKAEIRHSRQHFLKLHFPSTYESLMAAGISEDYTMGFAEKIGFRAGIALPYPFYNLKTESMTPLTIHPFVFMESTFMYYEKKDKEEIKKELVGVINEIKKVKGHFIPIWHNESLGENGKWTGWRELFEFMYKEASIV